MHLLFMHRRARATKWLATRDRGLFWVEPVYNGVGMLRNAFFSMSKQSSHRSEVGLFGRR
jgi:hypothetical protein